MISADKLAKMTIDEMKKVREKLGEKDKNFEPCQKVSFQDGFLNEEQEILLQFNDSLFVSDPHEKKE